MRYYNNNNGDDCVEFRTDFKIWIFRVSSISILYTEFNKF